MCARLVAQQLFVTWHHTRLAFIFYKYFSDLVFLELEKPYLSRPIYISHVWRYYINAPPTWHTNKGCALFNVIAIKLLLCGFISIHFSQSFHYIRLFEHLSTKRL